jgi:hypothetical protein
MTTMVEVAPELEVASAPAPAPAPDTDFFANINCYESTSTLAISCKYRNYTITAKNIRKIVYFSNVYSSLSLFYGDAFRNFAYDLMTLPFATRENIPANLENLVECGGGGGSDGKFVWKSALMEKLWNYATDLAAMLRPIIITEMPTISNPTIYDRTILQLNVVFPETLRDPLYKWFIPCTKYKVISNNEKMVENFIRDICHAIYSIRFMRGENKPRGCIIVPGTEKPYRFFINMYYNEAHYNKDFIGSQQYKDIIAHMGEFVPPAAPGDDEVGAGACAAAEV